MSQGYTKGIPVDTDPNMTANSDLLVPSQAAVVSYVSSYIVSGVTAVTASLPLTSSGGPTPNIAIPQASPIQDGYLSAADYVAFSSVSGGVSKGFVIAMAVAL